MRTKQQTWKDIVKGALIELGGIAHVKQIGDKLLTHPKGRNNRHIHAKVRQVCQTYSIFEHQPPEGSGIYKLVEEKTFDLDKEKIDLKQDNHGKIQGMLVEVGKVFGYQTIVSTRDMNRRVFQGKELKELCSMKELADVADNLDIKKFREIDVLWFYEHDDFLIPEYAFEIEETTNVKDGMRRLINIYKPYKTRLYVIVPTEKEEKDFNKYLNDDIYRHHKDKLKLYKYEIIENMYNSAIDFDRYKTILQFEYRFLI